MWAQEGLSALSGAPEQRAHFVWHASLCFLQRVEPEKSSSFCKNFCLDFLQLPDTGAEAPNGVETDRDVG